MNKEKRALLDRVGPITAPKASGCRACGSYEASYISVGPAFHTLACPECRTALDKALVESGIPGELNELEIKAAALLDKGKVDEAAESRRAYLAGRERLSAEGEAIWAAIGETIRANREAKAAKGCGLIFGRSPGILPL